MKRNLGSILLMICMLFSFTGCGQIGDKTANMGIIYGVTTFFSLLLIIVYCGQIRKKDAWFLLLFSSVFIVILGYVSLALSGTLEEALLANRIAYLGSLFLPLSMLFIILNVCKLNYSRWFVGFLLCISTIVFIIAASPGYSEIYYKSVTLSTVNGITVLNNIRSMAQHLSLLSDRIFFCNDWIYLLCNCQKENFQQPSCSDFA